MCHFLHRISTSSKNKADRDLLARVFPPLNPDIYIQDIRHKIYKMRLLGSSCEDYVTLRFLSTNLFLWGHELANSLRLFKLQRSFLQIIINFSWRQRLHFLLILL